MCQVDHNSLRESDEAWMQLPYVGLQQGGVGEYLILRNCACGSTLCRELGPDAEDA